MKLLIYWLCRCEARNKVNLSRFYRCYNSIVRSCSPDNFYQPEASNIILNHSSDWISKIETFLFNENSKEFYIEGIQCKEENLLCRMDKIKQVVIINIAIALFKRKLISLIIVLWILANPEETRPPSFINNINLG